MRKDQTRQKGHLPLEHLLRLVASFTSVMPLELHMRVTRVQIWLSNRQHTGYIATKM